MEVNYVERSNHNTIQNYSRVEFTELIYKLRNDTAFPPIELLTLLLLVYCTVGCIGNILICVVIISFKHMFTSINLYLFSLAVSDCLMLVSFTFGFLYCIGFGSRPSLTKLDFAFVLTSLVHVTASSASKVVTVVITIDRYIAVCHPFIGRKIFNRSRTVKIILSLWILSLIHATGFILCTGRYASKCHVMRNLVSMEFYSIVHFFIPVLVIIALYTLIVCKILSSSRMRETSSSRILKNGKHPYKKKLNISVAVVVEFIICFGPLNVFIFLIKYNHIEWINSKKLIIFMLGILLYILSTVINPIIYFVLSSKFRRAIKDLPYRIKMRWIQPPLKQFNGL